MVMQPPYHSEACRCRTASVGACVNINRWPTAAADKLKSDHKSITQKAPGILCTTTSGRVPLTFYTVGTYPTADSLFAFMCVWLDQEKVKYVKLYTRSRQQDALDSSAFWLIMGGHQMTHTHLVMASLFHFHNPRISDTGSLAIRYRLWCPVKFGPHCVRKR